MTEYENPRDHRIITNLVIAALKKDGPDGMLTLHGYPQNMMNIRIPHRL